MCCLLAVLACLHRRTLRRLPSVRKGEDGCPQRAQAVCSEYVLAMFLPAASCSPLSAARFSLRFCFTAASCSSAFAVRCLSWAICALVRRLLDSTFSKFTPTPWLATGERKRIREEQMALTRDGRTGHEGRVDSSPTAAIFSPEMSGVGGRSTVYSYIEFNASFRLI